MNKPLSRRLFGRVAATLPLAAQQAAKSLAIDAAAAKVVGDMAVAGVQLANGVAPMPYGGYVLRDPAMMALWKSGLAPEWLVDDIDQSINDAGRFLTTDVAALRSVSLSAKIDINVRRQRQRYMEKIERQSVLAAARDAYWSNKHK